MGSIGATELIVFLLVILLLFGSTKLPKLAKSLGEAQKEFKKGVAEAEAESAKPPADEKVTMTKSEYDALLSERDAEARRNAPPSV
ncbi:MAG: twin-arginine translocase TatA/TatE family subunit [Acidimicrobiales bacterium]